MRYNYGMPTAYPAVLRCVQVPHPQGKEERLSDSVNIHEAATLLGYGLAYTRRLCQTGELPATKPGRDWQVRRRDIDRFKATQPTRRRGPKPRPARRLAA